MYMYFWKLITENVSLVECVQQTNNIAIYLNSAQNKTQYEARGITTEFVGFLPQSLVLRSIVLGSILIYQSWSINVCILKLQLKELHVATIVNHTSVQKYFAECFRISCAMSLSCSLSLSSSSLILLRQTNSSLA